MRRAILFGWLGLLLAACAPPDAAQDGFSTEATLPGSVAITSPLTGSIIYSDSIFISGTAAGIPGNEFRLQVVDIDDDILYEGRITLDDATPEADGQRWSVEVVHGYAGDPTEAQIIALPVDAADDGITYDIETVALSSVANRPEGTFGMIFTPGEGATIGGDMILVTGTASGIVENPLLLRLEDSEGVVISEMTVSLDTRSAIDEISWEANLQTTGYTGEAVIRMIYVDAESDDEITLDTTSVTLAVAAG